MTTIRSITHEDSMRYGDWEVRHVELTTIALGISIKSCQGNICDSFHHSLLDLLNIIREITLQGGCFMPFVVCLSGPGDFRDRINLFKRRQDYHLGNFFFLPEPEGGSCEKSLSILLHPGSMDIKITPPRVIDLGTFREDYEREQAEAENIFGLFLKQLPTVQRSLTSWETFWENRFSKKESEEGTTPDETQGAERQDPVQEFSSSFGRLKTVDISNFKGIKKAEKIDVDADIILVTGANGNGKSSFVEAINLALTGHHPEMEKKDDFNSIPGHFLHSGAETFKISLAGENGSEIVTSCERNGDRLLAGKQTTIEYFDGNTVMPVPEQLNFRLTSYLPDHINLLFDENIQKEGDNETDILTVKDLFPTLPPAVEALKRVVKNRLEKLEELRTEDQNKIAGIKADASSIREQGAGFFPELASLLKPIDEAVGRQFVKPVDWDNVQDDPASVAGAVNHQKQNIFSHGNLVNWAELKKHLGNYKGKIPAFGEIVKLEGKKTEQESRIEELTGQLTGQLTSKVSQELTRLKKFFMDLADSDSRKRLLDALHSEGLNDIENEVKLVDPACAAICKQSLAKWGDEREELLRAELTRLQKELTATDMRLEAFSKKTSLTQALEKAVAFIKENNAFLEMIDSFMETYEQREKLKEKIDNHTTRIDALEGLKEFIKEKETETDAFKVAVEQSLRGVLKRFSMADGMDRVRVKDDFTIEADDTGQVVEQDGKTGRGLKCFSTGQRAQMGMAWLVACRELLHNDANAETIQFPHRVMIMDDPSTTFDMNNLHSQAILWRQLAYNHDPEKRFQIFIVSHHEEFSSKLLDLLCPPGGGKEKCSMKVIRFTDWKPGTGSRLKTFDVEPSPTNLEKTWDLLTDNLKRLEREI